MKPKPLHTVVPSRFFLEPPEDLRATPFSEDGHDYMLVSFPLPTKAAPHLTTAEREVLAGVMDGLTQAQVAASRGTSSRTVANQVAALFQKFKVSSRIELAREVAKLGQRKST